jgi:hypothetical protein
MEPWGKHVVVVSHLPLLHESGAQHCDDAMQAAPAGKHAFGWHVSVPPASAVQDVPAQHPESDIHGVPTQLGPSVSKSTDTLA